MSETDWHHIENIFGNAAMLIFFMFAIWMGSRDV
jgi:hypothetical protein